MKTYRLVTQKFIPIALALSMALFLGCDTKPRTQSTTEQQRKIEDDYQNALRKQKQLTSGYGQPMNYVAPSTGYALSKSSKGQQQQRQRRTQADRQQIEQGQSQQ